MNYGPKLFDLKTAGVYIIIESLPYIPFSEHNYKVIGAAHSLDVAKSYGGPNRIIKGPVPLFDNTPNELPIKHPFNPDVFPHPNIFQPNIPIIKPPVFNPFDPTKPKYDFGLPSSPSKFFNNHNNYNNHNNNNDSMDLS